MSVAPASTAVLSSVFRSMAGPGSHRQVQVDSLGGLRSFQPIRAAGVARGAREALDDAERHADEALRPVGVPARRAKLGLDRTPGQRKAGDPVGQARKALERELRAPRRGRVRAQCARERRRITVEVAVENRLGSEARGQKRLVHPVAGQRIDEPGRVADEQGALVRSRRAWLAHREPKAARALEPALGNPVLAAHAREMRAEPRPLAQPAADADVDVVTLREHPGVAARDRAELDQRAATEASRFDRLVRHVALECDRVVMTAAEADRPRGDSVHSVRADQRRGAHRHAVDGEASVGRDVADLRPLAEIGAGLRGLLGEERVETPPLRHEQERSLAAPLEPLPVSEPELERRYAVLDDGRHVDRDLVDRPVREPAAARLVAREARTVDQEDGRARAREPVRSRRPGRPGPDHDGVEPLHRPESTPANGGYNPRPPGEYPSGQRGPAVNRLAPPTEVRILSPPLSPSRTYSHPTLWKYR